MSNGTRRIMTAEERLTKRLTPASDGCIVWTGATHRNGYGVLSLGVELRKTWQAHRLAWTLANGPIPDGMHVLHRCDNPPCCNVDHLFLGTHADNMADKAAKGRVSRGNPHNASKTHCPQGHPYDELNTYHHPKGWRDCRTCRTESVRRRRAKAAAVETL